jgi:hypothetical protein
MKLDVFGWRGTNIAGVYFYDGKIIMALYAKVEIGEDCDTYHSEEIKIMCIPKLSWCSSEAGRHIIPLLSARARKIARTSLYTSCLA